MTNGSLGSNLENPNILLNTKMKYWNFIFLHELITLTNHSRGFDTLAILPRENYIDNREHAES